MSKLTGILTAVNDLVSGHPVCVLNSVVVLMTAGSEQLFDEFFFKCPKDRASAPNYARIFAYVPVFIMFFAGMVLNNRLGRIFHGFWKPEEKARLTSGQKSGAFFYIFFQSLVAPSVWLFAALLDSSFYVCIYAENPVDENEISRFKTQSQICAWILLLLLVMVGTSVTCCMRCWCTKAVQELRFAAIYNQEEEEELQKKMSEDAKVQATNYVKTLFSSANRTVAVEI